jgi:hypothetical protein
MNKNKTNNGSPVGKPTGRDNSKPLFIVGGNRCSKTQHSAKRIVKLLNGYAGTEPAELINEPIPQRTRLRTVYRVTKNGTFKWKEVIND